MAYRLEEVKTYKNIVVCDDCKRETLIRESSIPLGFDSKMNGTIEVGYTFKNVSGVFKNYCSDCRKRY